MSNAGLTAYAARQEENAGEPIGAILKIEKSVSLARQGPYFDSLRVKPNTMVYYRIRLVNYSVYPVDAECTDEMCRWKEKYRLEKAGKVTVILPMLVENNTHGDQHIFNVASVSYDDPTTGQAQMASDIAHVVCGPTEPVERYGQLLGLGEYSGGGSYNAFTGDLAGFLAYHGIGTWKHLHQKANKPAILFVMDTNAGDSFTVAQRGAASNGVRSFGAEGYGRCFVEGSDKPVKAFFTLKVTDWGEDGSESYYLRVIGPGGTSFTTAEKWKVFESDNPLTVRLE
jgi:hypothetical protein